jgi:hypothetical protein
MRIKAVFRDAEILKMEEGSKERIMAVSLKNLDRIVNLPKLLKVMGLEFDRRCFMLGTLKDSKYHVWLLNDSEQHLIYISEGKETDPGGYMWQ